jgi:hypothetical protein
VIPRLLFVLALMGCATTPTVAPKCELPPKPKPPVYTPLQVPGYGMCLDARDTMRLAHALVGYMDFADEACRRANCATASPPPKSP